MRARSSLLAVAVAGLAAALPAWAGDLAVEVSGIRSDKGRIGCALFAAEAGFPMDAAAARVDWQPARSSGVTCRFAGLPPGSYALAVSHDLNGNGKTDTNFLGMPTEDWGVSNNVRPSMRAPRFREAAFQIGEGTTRIAVAVGP
jgi:uncharacterized protein (DUF2141 family)